MGRPRCPGLLTTLFLWETVLRNSHGVGLPASPTWETLSPGLLQEVPSDCQGMA